MEMIEDLDEQIHRMEAEFVEGHGKPLTCEEISSSTTEEDGGDSPQRASPRCSAMRLLCSHQLI